MSVTAQTISCGSRTLRFLDEIKERRVKTDTQLQQDVIAELVVCGVAEERRVRGRAGRADVRGTRFPFLVA